MAYSKLHSSIVNSSLWVEDDSTRLLFITLLALADRHGMVYGTKIGLGRIANIDPEEISTAWDALLSPDSDSSDKIRAPENQGRRLEEVSGGFRLLNHEYYRGLRNDDDRREQNREAQVRFKKKVSRGKPRSATVSQDKPQKAHTEAETETDTTKDSIAPAVAARVEEAKEPEPRPAKPHFDALCEVCGMNPRGLSNGEGGRVGKALKGISQSVKLLKPDATEEDIANEIRSRGSNYRQNFPSAILTPTALEANWGLSQSAVQRSSNGQLQLPTEQRKKGW